MRIVKNGDVHVSAPISMPKKEVERFIEEHREWIAEARKKTYESQKRRADFYNQLPLKTREQADEALRRLKALIEPMVERHSKEMGVKPTIVYYVVNRMIRSQELAIRANLSVGADSYQASVEHRSVVVDEHIFTQFDAMPVVTMKWR